MKVLKLVQGTDEWLEARLQHFTASEAPAMMNESKYMSRNQLLALKKGWLSNPNSSFKEQLFQDGHEFEDLARPIVEMELLVELPPLVCSEEISGMLWLSSFDGLNVDSGVQWEHKSYNDTLAENVRNGVLEPHYYWQLEHQMLVSGLKETTFTVSDGTTDKKISTTYVSNPDRRLALIAGWKQFDVDLDTFEIKAKVETVKSVKTEDFPLIKYQVKETQIYSNITELLSFVQTKAQIELTRELETDQDFADKDVLNKATKTARADLKNVVKSIQNEFVSYSEFATVAADIDKVLQKMQSHGEKQVKDAKQAKKDKIEFEAENQIGAHTKKINKEIEPILLSSLMVNEMPDFQSAMKNKRTIESLQNAADDVVAKFKIEADQIANKVKENLLTMRELASEHKFLFSDTNQLVTKDNEDLVAVIKTRIADHEASEKVKADELREKIRLEEEEKAQKIIDDEAARVKEEQELADQKVIEDGLADAKRFEQPEEDIPFVNVSDGDGGNINVMDRTKIDGDESAPYDVPCETYHPETKEDILQQAFSHWWDGQLTIGKDPVLMDAFKSGAAWSNLIK